MQQGVLDAGPDMHQRIVAHNADVRTTRARSRHVDVPLRELLEDLGLGVDEGGPGLDQPVGEGLREARGPAGLEDALVALALGRGALVPLVRGGRIGPLRPRRVQGVVLHDGLRTLFSHVRLLLFDDLAGIRVGRLLTPRRGARIGRDRDHRDFERLPVHGLPDRDLVVLARRFLELVNPVSDADVADDPFSHVLPDRLDRGALREADRGAGLLLEQRHAARHDGAELVGDRIGAVGVQQGTALIQPVDPDVLGLEREGLDVALSGPPVHALDGRAGAEHQADRSRAIVRRLHRQLGTDRKGGHLDRAKTEGRLWIGRRFGRGGGPLRHGGKVARGRRLGKMTFRHPPAALSQTPSRDGWCGRTS